MQLGDVKRELGGRLRGLRKQRKLTLKDVAEKLGVQFGLLAKYESGMHVPPADKLIELSEIFDTSVDYLLSGKEPEKTRLHSVRLLERFEEIQKFGADEQENVIRLLDALIAQHNAERHIREKEQAAKSARRRVRRAS